MTQERAKHVIRNAVQVAGCFAGFRYDQTVNMKPSEFLRADGITREEDNYIRLIWSLMGDETSYYDAVVRIAEGL